uniref:cobaltochelatase subunit CobN n=1 Tax=Nocardia cyriacigeorgica TaxID=135487 RepID=UPI00245478AE
MILLLSTSDTDLLSARASGADYRWGNPARLLVEDLPALLDGADLVIVRILGGKRAWEEGLDAVRAAGVPMVALGGELAPDAELMECSTVRAGVAADAHNYLAAGGAENLRQLHNFLSDTVLLTGHGFEPPVQLPSWGRLEREAADVDGPTVAVIYYRAQHLAGNTAYIDALCTAIEQAGARPLPLYCASLRTAEPDLLDTLRAADALVVTVLAAGGTKPATASAGGDDEAWDVGALAELDVPILQGLCLTTGREQWEANDDGLSPLDVATQVAVPEFDGRIITVPFSFKEFDADGLSTYVPDPERAEAKQISAVSTFEHDIVTLDRLRLAIDDMAASAHRRLARDGRAARTVVLKLKKSDMSIVTRSFTLPYATEDLATLTAAAQRSAIDPRELGPV